MPKSDKLIVIKCIDCSYQASGLSERAVMAALADHRRFEQVIKPVEVCQ